MKFHPLNIVSSMMLHLSTLWYIISHISLDMVMPLAGMDILFLVFLHQLHSDNHALSIISSERHYVVSLF